jgi:hypothetical protein
VPEVAGSLPSVVCLISDTPEPSPSFALSASSTPVVLQPAPFGAGESTAAVVGGVVSIRMPALASDATPPIA